MIRLILILLFWPVIVWFYGSIIGIAIILLMLTAEAVQRNLPWILGAVGLMLLGYLIFKYRCIAVDFYKGRQSSLSNYQHASSEMAKREMITVEKFVPTTNLYCYWCTAKLGIKAWERGGRYYCEKCYQKGNL